MAKMQRKPKESPMSCSENTNATVGDLLESLDDAVAPPMLKNSMP